MRTRRARREQQSARLCSHVNTRAHVESDWRRTHTTSRQRQSMRRRAHSDKRARANGARERTRRERLRARDKATQERRAPPTEHSQYGYYRVIESTGMRHWTESERRITERAPGMHHIGGAIRWPASSHSRVIEHALSSTSTRVLTVLAPLALNALPVP